MNVFKTTRTEIIQFCHSYFCFELPSVMLKKSEKFRNKYNEYYYTCYDI